MGEVHLWRWDAGVKETACNSCACVHGHVIRLCLLSGLRRARLCPPDLVAEGIIKVKVGEEGLHFIKHNSPGEPSHKENWSQKKLFKKGQIRKHPLKYQLQITRKRRKTLAWNR